MRYPDYLDQLRSAAGGVAVSEYGVVEELGRA